MKQWLSRTVDGKFLIVKVPCPHPSINVDMGKPPSGVLHTTEGSYESALGVFHQHFAPHFLVGSKRIAQLVPLGKMASALENVSGGSQTNKWARVQIEVAAHSKDTPYVFDAGTMDALASLLATVKVEAGIPLLRPYPDAMPPKPWATPSFRRRHDGKWGDRPGWYGHVEIPENSHWDPGALMWTPLLRDAERRLPKPKPPPPPKKSGHWQVVKTFYDGKSTTENVGALRIWVLKQGDLHKKGVRDVKAHWVETA